MANIEMQRMKSFMDIIDRKMPKIERLWNSYVEYLNDLGKERDYKNAVDDFKSQGVKK